MKWNEYGTSKSSLFNYVCLQRYLREGATGLEYFFHYKVALMAK